MRKIIVALSLVSIMCFALMLTGCGSDKATGSEQTKSASSAEINSGEQYLGTYGDGQAAYLLTESISAWGTGDSAGYTCTVKSVDPSSKKFTHVNYKIMFEPSIGISKDGKNMGMGQSEKLLKDKTSVEYQLIQILRANQQQTKGK